MFLRITAVCFAVVCLRLAGGEIQIRVTSDPKLPAPNLISAFCTNADFESGLAGWKWNEDQYREGVDFAVIGDPVQGKAVCFHGYNRNIWCAVPIGKFQKGTPYIASCRIKPGKNLPRTGSLGFTITFWPADWKNGHGFHARGAGAEHWKTVTGKPFSVPEDAVHCQFSVGMGYHPGSGCVDDLVIREAYAKLRVTVTAPQVIRQVKIVNGGDETIFDSGIMRRDSRHFSKVLQVESAGVYTVLAVTDDGDVGSFTYPEQKERRN